MNARDIDDEKDLAPVPAPQAGMAMAMGSETHLPKGDVTNVDDVAEAAKLNRGLKPRHVTMISLGGVLGTGLFLYTGDALANGGPLGIMLGFIFMGSVCLCVMISVGEMVAFAPLPGGPITLAARYVDRSLSFTLGWFYWYTWTIFLPSELSAISVLINLWNDTISNALWISLFLVAAVIINLFGSSIYGECEFWLSSVKIVLITGLIIVGIVISAGGVPGQDPIGFRYWRNPGPFVQYAGIAGSLGRFLGFWTTLTQAAFSYIGSEIVAIAGGESRNPRVSLPRAIKSIYVRLVLFYILGVFVITITVASNDERLSLNSGTALASPFVIAIETAGIRALPSIVNAGLLVSGLSAANSELFTSSRALHGLAIRGHAPALLGRTTTKGVPYVAILICAAFASLAYMSLGSTAGEAFGYLAALGSAGGLLMWWGMCFTYIRFNRGLRHQAIPRSTLPYSHSLNRNAGAAYYAICFISLVLFFSAWQVFMKDSWDTATFLTSYLPVILFPIVYTAHKLYTKSPLVSLADMDLEERVLNQIEADEVTDSGSRKESSKFWAILA